MRSANKAVFIAPRGITLQNAITTNNPVGIKKNERLNCECGIRDWVVLVFLLKLTTSI